MFKTTPTAPLILTLAGILPFIGLSAGVAWFREDIALSITFALWLLIYGAVISSFVAGIRWGVEIGRNETPSGFVLFVSIVPPLFAWLIVGLYFRYPSRPEGFLALAVLFAGLYVWDRGSDDLPNWYRDLRVWPTLGAGLSLVLAYVLLR
ncbi:MAG: DUF3429 domain-containing protein [Pseudomonadota bacterium]